MNAHSPYPADVGRGGFSEWRGREKKHQFSSPQGWKEEEMVEVRTKLGREGYQFIYVHIMGQCSHCPSPHVFQEVL